ncbi:hypothetical protein E2C01_077267 [Portunus trituberculatus]|uniref:Uncharacterized protein n=1 Tax=Portunus trituberculatus TaxID=210409 RepID=A0A5B7IFE6_PORTR|nr:hypothetical protein [Portunus trituberculatus]
MNRPGLISSASPARYSSSHKFFPFSELFSDNLFHPDAFHSKVSRTSLTRFIVLGHSHAVLLLTPCCCREGNHTCYCHSQMLFLLVLSSLSAQMRLRLSRSTNPVSSSPTARAQTNNYHGINQTVSKEN